MLLPVLFLLLLLLFLHFRRRRAPEPLRYREGQHLILTGDIVALGAVFHSGDEVFPTGMDEGSRTYDIMTVDRSRSSIGVPAEVLEAGSRPAA
jgi:hypothetical protein